MINRQSFLFTLFLGALGALPPLSIDMGLPALSSIGRSLKTSDSAAALTLSLFLAGFALAPVICGPLSDRFGRRPLLLFGCIFFALAGIGCAIAPTIELLLLFRLFQGIGAGAGGVLAMAIVRDLFEGNHARARLSYVNIVRSIAPMIAPTLGSFVLLSLGWRWIYGLLAIGGVFLLITVYFGFAESATHEKVPFTLPTLISNYKLVLTNKICCGYAVINACMFGGLFSYVSNSPLLMTNVFKVSTQNFGYIFAFTAFGIMSGAFTNGKLSERNVPHTVPLSFGLSLASSAVLTNLLITLAGFASVYTLLPCLFLCFYSAGLVAPNSAHGCLHPVPKIAGIASAVLTFTQMVTGAFSSALVAFIYDGRSALAMTGTMVLFIVSAWIVYFTLVRPSENQSIEINETVGQN